MDEYVVRTVIGLNEPIALLGVEPFHCSASHHMSFKHNTPPSSTGWRIKISARNGKQVRRSNELGNADEPREIDPSNMSWFFPYYKINVRSRVPDRNGHLECLTKPLNEAPA